MDIVAERELNKIFPDSILKFFASGDVSNPFSVALNGGEVSVGGQHNVLSSLADVTVRFAPELTFSIVPLLIVIDVEVKLVITVSLAN